MKNDIKEIITEAVLGFLNESAREEKPEDRKKINLKPHTDTSFPVNVQQKNKVKIHPKFNKPQSSQLQPPGVNEEEEPFDEDTKKKFLKAIQTKDR